MTYLDRTSNIDVNKVAGSTRESDVNVHCHELSLMWILRDEGVLLDLRLSILADFKTEEHQDRC